MRSAGQLPELSAGLCPGTDLRKEKRSLEKDRNRKATATLAEQQTSSSHTSHLGEECCRMTRQKLLLQRSLEKPNHVKNPTEDAFV